MEQTQARVLMGLAAVLLAATTLLYVLEPEEDPDPEASSPVWQVQAEDIVRVEVERADGTLILARDGETWRVEAPVAAEAEPQAVERMLEALEGVRKGLPIADAAAPEEYGLGDPPVARVRVRLEDGEERLLEVGDAAPVGHRTYVRDARGEVVAVEGRPGQVLTEPASRFRDHRIFDFDPADVRRVTLDGPEGVLSVHGQGTSWWLDGFSRADPDRVDDLVVGLLDLRFDLFMDLDGLANPERTATVELQDGEVQRLFVGEQTPKGRVVWTDEGKAGVAFPDSLRLLGQGPTDIGDPRAFPIDLERVDAVAVTRGDRRVEAVRDGNAWRVDDRVAPDAQVAVERLAQAAMHYRREPVSAPIEVWAMVEITSQGRMAVIDLGQVAEGTFRVAKDRAGGAPYLVPVDDLEPLDLLLKSTSGG